MFELPQFSGRLRDAEVRGENDPASEKSGQRRDVGLHSRVQSTNLARGIRVSLRNSE